MVTLIETEKTMLEFDVTFDTIWLRSSRALAAKQKWPCFCNISRNLN